MHGYIESQNNGTESRSYYLETHACYSQTQFGQNIKHIPMAIYYLCQSNHTPYFTTVSIIREHSFVARGSLKYRDHTDQLELCHALYFWACANFNTWDLKRSWNEYSVLIWHWSLSWFKYTPRAFTFTNYLQNRTAMSWLPLESLVVVYFSSGK